MTVRIPTDLKKFVELLNQNKVKYLIVGGYALAFHGYPRYTGDIDILIKPDSPNAKKIIDSIDDFGFGTLNISREDFLVPGTIIQLGFPPSRIDLLTRISGIEFDLAWNNKVLGQLDDISANFIGLEDLKTNKASTGRSKDIADLEVLKKL